MKDTSFVVSNLATASYATLTWNFLRISRKNHVLSDKNIFLNNTSPPRKEEINWVAFSYLLELSQVGPWENRRVSFGSNETLYPQDRGDPQEAQNIPPPHYVNDSPFSSIIEQRSHTVCLFLRTSPPEHRHPTTSLSSFFSNIRRLSNLLTKLQQAY